MPLSKTKIIIASIIALIVIFTFGGCEQSPRDTFSEIPIIAKYTVEYEVLATMKDVDARYNEIWNQQTTTIIKRETGSMYAFAYRRGKTCVIVIAQSSEYSLQQYEITVGHENLHCMYGAWHG